MPDQNNICVSVYICVFVYLSTHNLTWMDVYIYEVGVSMWSLMHLHKYTDCIMYIYIVLLRDGINCQGSAVVA